MRKNYQNFTQSYPAYALRCIDNIYIKILNNKQLLKEKIFLNKKLSRFVNTWFDSELTESTIDIITIAFNNSETIKNQYHLLRKNLNDNFRYIVIDNSTKHKISGEIKLICEKFKINYVRLSGNIYNGVDPSKSHGLSLNWAYNQIIKNSKANYFGIIDHDIYPIKETSVVNYIKKFKIWGHYQKRGKRWYIWPGFSFYKKSITEVSEINFMPIKGLDTGGANWEYIYKKHDPLLISWPKMRYIKYWRGKDIQNTSVEIIGDWLHLMNTSGWKDGNVKVSIKELVSRVIKRIENDKKLQK